jgi:AdoMet-dependent heme synthase
VIVRATGDVFAKAPFIVFWETTRACDLVCVHCRACAIPRRDPRELTTQEGKDLLTEIHGMGCPLVVLTGGDPAKRPDLVELVRHGTQVGLRMALTPSATPLIDRSLLEALRGAGLARLAVSLDGATAATHDGFRGVPGSYARTFDILRAARVLGLTTQINTTISKHNIDDLERIAAQCADLDINLWSVFLLVPTGRGAELDLLDPDRVESLLQRLARISTMVPFDVKTTAAPHFRRVLLQQKVARGDIAGLTDDGIGRAPRGVNDGQGIAFVSHVGDIFPSGFLPIRCGNVRDGGLTRTYRMHPLFRTLRDPDQLGGKCGVCEFRRVCGGSRARAYAMLGDPMAYDPSCAYVPRRWPEEDTGGEERAAAGEP